MDESQYDESQQEVERQSLSDRQRALAQRLTRSNSPNHREPFSRLDDLDQLQIKQAIETLVRKRISQTRELLPLSAGFMGLKFAEQFREYSCLYHWNGHRALWLDALGFANWLKRQGGLEPWLIDSLRRESIQIRWQISRVYFSFARLRYEVDRLKAISESTPIQRRSSYILAWRLGRFGKVWRIA